MSLIERIESVFPQASDIPVGLRHDIPFAQTGYLINGEIRQWDGPQQQVLSPVWVSIDGVPKAISNRHLSAFIGKRSAAGARCGNIGL